ncbi:MAG: hypothetical protein WBD95_06030 [Xanthobacteraceae bacterium]
MNEKRKEYARYAQHCLQMVAATREQEARSIQREMAAEWLRLADAMRRPSKPRQMQMM